ncbi:DUF952 domain-containing protein [Arsenicibacter rosenii]|uniref:DUF952 domain-containing protein n=1 Tax=Arsenicibacter rosenii TaxID=1750698 RepID=A0A1S2VJQ4_9BACT|nr:DUF952 domain-containing protein [Arsenicibacter rosenii]OIN58963.1 hypothetical protein BLX24_12150 [Arsenicibacter rosenii]
MHIYHITTKAWWETFAGKTHYLSPTFEQETFIHLSKPDQVAGVLERYYAGKTGLLKLHIDPDKLTAPLIYEPSTNQELFPHLYGPLNKEAIDRIEAL